MARKPRYRPEEGHEQIHIERNVIERFLMLVKDLIRKNRKVFLFCLLGFFMASILFIVGLVVVDGIRTRNEARFEKIVDEYARLGPSGDNEKRGRIVSDLKRFVEASRIGPARGLGYYTLGDILYDRKDYREAARYFTLYADGNSKTVLAPMALMKAAISFEEAGDPKGALAIYKRLDEKYSESIVADQLYYHFARICGMTGDLFNARAYYNKVIASFPESVFAPRARKRLFMLGAE